MTAQEPPDFRRKTPESARFGGPRPRNRACNDFSKSRDGRVTLDDFGAEIGKGTPRFAKARSEKNAKFRGFNLWKPQNRPEKWKKTRFSGVPFIDFSFFFAIFAKFPSEVHGLRFFARERDSARFGGLRAPGRGPRDPRVVTTAKITRFQLIHRV